MVPTHDHLVVLCTAPSLEVARKLARGLVRERLAACVNLVPNVLSVYEWKDELHEDEEVQMVIKTHRDRIDAIGRHLAAHHPYEVPEILALAVTQGDAPYLAWLDERTRPS